MKVSNHAVLRYQQRNGKTISCEAARIHISNMWKTAEPLAILSRRGGQHYRSNKWTLVIQGGEVRTVYKSQGGTLIATKLTK